MKKLIFLLAGLLLINLDVFSQATLNWHFANPQVTPGPTEQFKFDVQFKSDENTVFLGGVLIFNYDKTVFGDFATVNITPGPKFQPPFNPAQAIAAGKVSYDLTDFTLVGAAVGLTYETFCTVTIDIVEHCGNPGIEFNTEMDGTSFYSPGNFYAYDNSYEDNLLFYTLYVPVLTTWTGAEDSDWDNPGNWSDCVPGVTSNVIIGISSNYAETPGAITFNDLTINPGGGLTATAGALTVTGNLLIESDPTGTGSLIHNNALSGVVERNLKGWGSYSALLKNGHGWHLLSSPVAAQTIAPFQDLTNNDDFYKWNEPANVWKNRRQTGGSIIPDPAFDTQFEVGAGYLVAYEADKDFTFTGVLNTDDVSVSGLTNTDPEPIHSNYYGYHQLGNPYSSALTWNNSPDWNFIDVANYAQIWKESDASYSVLNLGDPIPAMQGFFVYTENGNGSLIIPASQRVHDATPYYKDAQQQIVLSARDLDHQMKQESKIAFNADATVGFDMEYDAYFMGGYAPRFYSVSEGAAYALNTLPAMTEDLVIPFTFVKNEGTNFQITLDAALDYGTIYLVDKKINVTENLTQTGSYSFVAAQGDDANRFLLKFGAVGIDDPAAGEAAIEIFAAGDALYLNAKQPGNATVSVYDILGRTVLTTEVNMTPSASVDVSRLSGTYIVRAIANGEVVSAKVFIR